MPLGRITTDITKLIIKDLQLPLITALHRAKGERSTMSYLGIKVKQEDRVRYLKLEVTYNESNKLADDFFTIVIQEDETPQPTLGEKFEVDAEASQRLGTPAKKRRRVIGICVWNRNSMLMEFTDRSHS